MPSARPNSSSGRAPKTRTGIDTHAYRTCENEVSEYRDRYPRWPVSEFAGIERLPEQARRRSGAEAAPENWRNDRAARTVRYSDGPLGPAETLGPDPIQRITGGRCSLHQR